MKYPLLVAAMIFLTACESFHTQKYREDMIYGDEASVPVVYAKAETTPVQSSDDAADDPAIWYNPNNPAESLILGTDKKAGLGIYTLAGELKQFIPAGLPNNVDLRQNIQVGDWTKDLAVASNRDGDVVTLFTINAAGGSIVGDFPAGLSEPYGICMGMVSGQLVVFVTYKTGEVQAHLIHSVSSNNIEQEIVGTIPFATQLEGCVHDDDSGVLYIGEEEHGLWRTAIALEDGQLLFSDPSLVDEVSGTNGIAADVEGVALYRNNENENNEKSYVIASSQGNDSYAVYEHSDGNRFVGRFRIANNTGSGIDGSQETDGLEVDARSFGADFPQGILVVQDGYNAPVAEPQNFKIVDWRDVAKALGLSD